MRQSHLRVWWKLLFPICVENPGTRHPNTYSYLLSDQNPLAHPHSVHMPPTLQLHTQKASVQCNSFLIFLEYGKELWF